MWNHYLFMETPDDYLVSWTRRRAKSAGISPSPIWRKVTSRRRRRSWSAIMCWWERATTSMRRASCNRSIPETGDLQWKFYTVPMKKGDPGLDTWGSLDAARHGGAQTWIPGAYDPETHLYIFGTGNPTPAFHDRDARPGRQPVHLCSDCAERGYRQDGLVLPDFAARHARLRFGANTGAGGRSVQGQDAEAGALTAARNGYYFTLDRVTGEHLVTSK